jgi:hypothetical protein
LQLTLPPWIPRKKAKDNWQTTAWREQTGLSEQGPATIALDHHH